MSSDALPLRTGRLAALAALAALASCSSVADGGYGGECTEDVQCDPGDVCARDRMCAPAADVREVLARWTIGGQPASATTCARAPDLAIGFVGQAPGDVLAFAPVPCAIGQFRVDKLPRRFTAVELGPEDGAPQRRVAIPASNEVQLDLP